jgi:hypothetical protein
MVMAIYVWRRGLSNARAAHPEGGTVSWPILGGLLALAVMSLSIEVLYQRSLWLLVGCVLAACWEAPATEAETIQMDDATQSGAGNLRRQASMGCHQPARRDH